MRTIESELLRWCVTDGKLVLPNVGALSDRARRIEARYWVGYGDAGLAELALGNAELFPLVWGLDRSMRLDPSGYLEHGEVKLFGHAWQRVVRGVREMRRCWVRGIAELSGEVLVEGDSKFDRFLLGEVLGYCARHHDWLRG